jgi:competence protein ComEA
MKDIINRYKMYLIGGILLLLALTLFLIFNKNDSVEASPIKEEQLEKKEDKEEVKEEMVIYVDIKGEVKKPGIYKANINTRVNDIILLAGGLTKNANTRSINLSKKVIDEMVIIVHSKSEISDFSKTMEKEKSISLSCNLEEYNLVNNACINTNNNETSSTNSLISLNTATKEELMTISGIGEKKALDIISYRNLNGGFKSIEEVMNISGIGEALFAQIKDYITI